MIGQDITGFRRPQKPDVFFSYFFIDMSKNALKMSRLPYLKGTGSQTVKSRALPESQHHKQLTNMFLFLILLHEQKVNTHVHTYI